MLATTAARVSYQGNGVTTAFTWPYDIISTDQLAIYLVDTDGATEQTTGFTVSLSGSPTNGIYSGATITFSVAPSASYAVRIDRTPELTQEFDFDSESDPLPVLTRYADLTEMKLQSVQRQIDDIEGDANAALPWVIATGSTEPRSLSDWMAKLLPAYEPVSAAQAMPRLTANLNVYVRKDGSDANTGIANTAGGAFLTIQKAVNLVCGYDHGDYQVTINVGADGGTPYDEVQLFPCRGSKQPKIIGDTATPANVRIRSSDGTFPHAAICCYWQDADWQVQGFKLENTGSAFSSVDCAHGGNVNLGYIEFGESSGSAFGGHIVCLANGTVTFSGPITFLANAYVGLYASFGGVIIDDVGNTWTHTGTPAYSRAFIEVIRGGSVSFVTATTFTGSATGVRFRKDINAALYTKNADPDSTLPGNAAGVYNSISHLLTIEKGLVASGLSTLGDGIANLNAVAVKGAYSECVLGMSDATVSLTGTITETVLATVNKPANEPGINGMLSLLLQFTGTNNANNKTIRIRAGGIGGTVLWSRTFTTDLGGVLERHVKNLNSHSAQVSFNSATINSYAANDRTTYAINFANALDLVVTGELANTGDTMRCDLFKVSMIHKD